MLKRYYLKNLFFKISLNIHDKSKTLLYDFAPMSWYKYWNIWWISDPHSCVVLLSGDKNLCNKAVVNGIEVFGKEVFVHFGIYQ